MCSRSRQIIREPKLDSYQASLDGIAYRDTEIVELKRTVETLERSNKRLRAKLDRLTG